MEGPHRPSRRFSGLAGANGPVQPGAYLAPRLTNQSPENSNISIFGDAGKERAWTGFTSLCDKPDRVYHIRLPPLGDGDESEDGKLDWTG